MTHLKFGFVFLTIVVALPIGCSDKSVPSSKSEPPRNTGPASVAPSSPSATPTVPVSPKSPAESPAPKDVDLLKPKADVIMKPEQVLAEYMKDSDKFLKNYEGKVIEVTGQVKNYSYAFPGSTDQGFLVLTAPVLTKFDCKDPHPMSKAMPGQTVTLRALCEPGFGIRDWKILRVEGAAPPEMSAEQFAKDYAADKEGMDKKFKDKYLIFTGTIQSVDAKKRIIQLTPSEVKPAIECFFIDESLKVAERNGWFKKGAPVRVLGVHFYDDPALRLCVILPPAK